jgi:glutathione S-transferase
VELKTVHTVGEAAESGENMITLYGHPYSHNSRKIHWALEEMNVEYQYKTIDLMSAEQKNEDFVQMNPNGRVPVIEHENRLIYESNAILAYFMDALGEHPLSCSSNAHRAGVLQWLSWQASDLASALLEPWLMKFYETMGTELDKAAHLKLCEAAKAPLMILESHLERRSTVTDQFSMADIAMAESVLLAEYAGISLDTYAHTRAWLGNVKKRGAFEKTRPVQ